MRALRVGALGAAGAVTSHLYNKRVEAAQLQQTGWASYELIDRKVMKDVALLRFSLGDNAIEAGFDVGSCVVVGVPDRLYAAYGGAEAAETYANLTSFDLLDGDASKRNEVTEQYKGNPSLQLQLRPYTPLSRPSDKGYIDLAVKREAWGSASEYLHNMEVGSKAMFKGPVKKFEYAPNMAAEIGMVAGGTGVNPMMQVIRAIFDNPADNTKVSLVWGSKNGAFYCKDELEELSKKNPGRLSVTYLEQNWNNIASKEAKNNISAGLLGDAMPPPSDETLILVCGSVGMTETVAGAKKAGDNFRQPAVRGALGELGYEDHMVFRF